MQRCTLFVALILLVGAIDANLGRIKVDAEGHWFVDEYGRVRLFHGVNAVNKEIPWYPAYFLNESRLDDLVKFGFNVVRLGSMWSGVEPVEGEYNATYVSILRRMVDDLSARGIYTMLDMHQDCLSSRTGSYDGIPAWLYDSFPPPTNPYPYPLDSVDYWEQGYLTQAVSEGFQHLYNNTSGAIEKWAEMWAYLAEEFLGDASVLGYNYINEPWIGDYLANPDLVASAVAGRENLLPSYDAITARLREVDTEGIVFYEPVFYGQLMLVEGEFFGTGFDRVPGGAQYADVSALSYHTYCWFLEFEVNGTGDAIEGKEICENYLLPKFFQSQADSVNITGGAAILTEFGLCKTHGDAINVECSFFMDLADEWLQSWIEWEGMSLFYNENGEWDLPELLPHVRTYARAIAGIPLRMFFNESTAEFILEYSVDPRIGQPTEISVPLLRYPDGFSVEVSEGLRWESGADMILVYHENIQDTMEVRIQITSNTISL